MEGLFKIWDKIQNINIDFIIFVFVIIFIFKFKDIFELSFKHSTHRTDQLNAAKKLLEDAGYTDSKEMKMIKTMMKTRAVKIATNLISERHGNLYCYLFSKCIEEEVMGLHKVLPYIDTQDDDFSFDDNALRKRRVIGVILIMMIIAFNLYMNIIFKDSPDINLSWFFNSLIIIEVIIAFHWWANIMPNDVEVKNIKKLLKKSSVKEFNSY